MARASGGTIASAVTSPVPRSSASALSDELAQRSVHYSAGKTAIVAVKPCRKLRPPTGPISPAQKKPAVGRAQRVLDRRRVVVRHLEHVGAAAVAGEEQRARGAAGAERLRLGAQRLAQVLVGRRAVADLQPHGLAHPDPLADRDRSRLSGRRR